MSKQLVFTRKLSPQGKIQEFVKKFSLEFAYGDEHETIYKSESIILSVTKRVTWILLTDRSSSVLKLEVSNFFDKGRNKNAND